MIPLLNIFNIFSTIRTLGCFSSAELIMFVNIFKLNFFIAKFTRLWLLGAFCQMILKCIITCSESALFTYYFFMFFFLVFFFVSFRHALITLLTPIILPWTSDIMHSKFGDGYLLIADSAHFCFFYRLFGFHYFFI